jgi:hypothetical protein
MRLAVFVALVTACHPAPRPTPLDSAEVLFWDVFSQHRYERIGEARAALERAIAEHPDRARPHLLLGTLFVWQLAEPGLSHLADPAETAGAAELHLERYAAMAPDDARVATWLAPVLLGEAGGMRAGAEHIPDAAQKQALLARADAVAHHAHALLDEGVQREPRFNLFGRILVDTDGAGALDDVAALLRVRIGTDQPNAGLRDDSRCHPEAPPPPPFAATSEQTTFNRDAKCWDSWKTPFAYEGFWLFLGDVERAHDKLDVARAMYENARRLPSYRRWPFSPLVEARLAGKPEPPAWKTPYQCVICHTRPDLPAP